MKKLAGKTAFITGGASGIGKAIAERFTAEGATVVIADINEEDGHTLAQNLQGYFIKTDVADAEAVKNAIQQTITYTQQLDILVNNAGIDGIQAPVHENTLENWHHVMGINLHGVFYGMKYGLEQFIKQGTGGVIINIASIAGLSAFADASPYCASKVAVVHLTRSAAIEYGKHNIRVNAIAPAAVLTPLLQQHIDNSNDPVARKEYLESLSYLPGMLLPEDIAAVAAFLASNDARYVSGVTIPVDGGYTAG